MHKKLFIPGPVEVRDDVLEKMSTPMIGHRTKDASKLQKDITDKMRKLMYTQEAILLSTSSGSGLMEGAVRSCTRKRAAVFSIGAFGDRWFKMCTANGVPADKISSELGFTTTPEMVDETLATGKYDLITITHNETATGVMNPVNEIAEVMKKYPDVIWCLDTVSSLGGSKIEVDKLGVDICIASTQKCLGLPPGMAVCSFSKKAIEAAKQVECRGLYFDLLEIYDYVIKKDHQYPSTPSLSHMYALDYQLDCIMEEGLDNRFSRHIEMAEIVRNWARKNFKLLAEDNSLSNTVTCIRNTKNIDFSALNKALGERGWSISNGYGALKDVTFRIAHMADATLDQINNLLADIEDILNI